MKILTILQESILQIFSELPDGEAFYLSGGTALSAFFLEHRKSHDLDFFTSAEELILPISQKLEVALKNAEMRVERSRGFGSFVELYVTQEDDSTTIHLAVDSPFRFEQPQECEQIPGLKIDSLIDMASNKLLTLFGRAAIRDFIDVYFLVREHFQKEELIEKARKKDPGFDLYWLGVAMEIINDFPDDTPDMLLLERPCSMGELKEFFSEWRQEIQKEIMKE